MTPKEKAIELRDKFYKCPEVQEKESKRCALIAVDEILNLDYFSPSGRDYWQQVKQEIVKL